MQFALSLPNRVISLVWLATACAWGVFSSSLADSAMGQIAEAERSQISSADRDLESEDGGSSRELPPSHSVTPRLYATGFEFAEGPAFDDAGNLYVVNYRGNGKIGRIQADGTASVWCDLTELAPLTDRRPQATRHGRRGHPRW